MKKIEKIIGGVVYTKPTNDLIDNTEELDKRVIENKDSIQNLESKVIKNSNDISSNYTTLNNKINNLQTGSGGTGGGSSSDNSYMDFKLSPWEVEEFAGIAVSGILRIQGGMFQLYVDVDFYNIPVFENSSGYVVKIVDKNDYIKSMLLSQNSDGYTYANGVMTFNYSTTGKYQTMKSYIALILPEFYGIEGLGIYFLGSDEFNEGSDVRSFTYSASGFIGEARI